MKNPSRYHESIRNEKHIFLCAISGRSSSTAFQRILNSSNEVWIWGEPHGILKQLYSIILRSINVKKNDRVQAALNAMYHSYLDNKHLAFYPNAVGNLDKTIDILNNTISIFLRPWAPKVKRFGFKEIDWMPIGMLDHLKEVYPQSFFIFCFRDPLRQWPSLCKLNLDVSSDLDLFLKQYHSMATTYMKFAEKSGNKAFIENLDLRDLNKVKQIICHLEIQEIDTALIDVTVHTIKPKKLSKTDSDKILNSSAYQSYLKMQEISRSFYEQKQSYLIE